MGKRGPKPGTGGKPVKWTEERLDDLAEAMVAFFDENQNACFLEDFCAQNRLWPQRISEWERKNANLAEARKAVDALTASRVANKGLTGGANPTMCIFSLKQKGWSDLQKIEQKTDITSNGETLGAASLAIYATNKD